MHIMAEISLVPIHRSAVPQPCQGDPEHVAVSRVTVSFGLGREAESLWCLPCLDRVDLPSVLALLNADVLAFRVAAALRVVS